MERVLVFGLVFAGAGVLGTFAGLVLWRRHRRLLASLTVTRGRIVEIQVSDVDGQEMFQPVVEFAVGERTFRAIDGTFHGVNRWRIGEPHVVYYDPDSPATNQLSRDTGSAFGAVLFGGIGVVLLVIGAIALAGHASGDSALGRFLADALS